MPQPRMSTGFAAAGSSTFASSFVEGSFKAVVVGVFGDNNSTVYVNLNGNVVRAQATIDAAIQVGDIVWVQKTTSGYIIQGTA